MADTPLRPDADPSWRELHALADAVADAVAAAILAGFAAWAAAADWDEIERAFAFHDVERALYALRLDRLGTYLAPLEPILLRLSSDAAELTADTVAPKVAEGDASVSAALQRDADPGRVAAAAALWAAWLLYMNQHTAKMARGLVTGLFTSPGSPASTASILRVALGLNTRQAGALVRRIDALTADGTPWRRVVLIARRQATNAAVERARVLAGTETLRWATESEVAVFRSAVGGSDEWQLEWLTIIDARTCKVCIPLDGTRIKVTDQFYSEVEREVVGLPPIHSDCRCRVILVHNGAFVRQVAPYTP